MQFCNIVCVFRFHGNIRPLSDLRGINQPLTWSLSEMKGRVIILAFFSFSLHKPSWLVLGYSIWYMQHSWLRVFRFIGFSMNSIEDFEEDKPNRYFRDQFAESVFKVYVLWQFYFSMHSKLVFTNRSNWNTLVIRLANKLKNVNDFISPASNVVEPILLALAKLFFLAPQCALLSSQGQIAAIKVSIGPRHEK